MLKDSTYAADSGISCLTSRSLLVLADRRLEAIGLTPHDRGPVSDSGSHDNPYSAYLKNLSRQKYRGYGGFTLMRSGAPNLYEGSL